MERATLPATEVEVIGTVVSQPKVAVPDKIESSAIETNVSTPNQAQQSDLSVSVVAAVVLLAFAAGLEVSWAVLRYHVRTPDKTKNRPVKTDVEKLPGNNLKYVRSKVLQWSQECFPEKEIRNLEDVCGLFNSPELTDLLRRLNESIYSDNQTEFPIDKLEKIMRSLAKKTHKKSSKENLLPKLYK